MAKSTTTTKKRSKVKTATRAVKNKENGVPQALWDLMTNTLRGIDNLRASQKELRESQKETDRQMKETDLKMQATDRLLKDLGKKTGNLGNRWGDFMESLVEGDLIRLLNERGIKVQRLAQIRDFKYKGKNYEYDLIAINGDEVVVVEVKSSLYLKEVQYFMEEKLMIFKEVCNEYKNKVVYGAVAYLKVNQGAGKYAEKQGLFVIKAPGGESKVSTIINDENFKPVRF